MFPAGGGVVLGAVVGVLVVAAVVAGVVEATGAAPGSGCFSFVEQAASETTRMSAQPPMATGRRLTTRDSITPEPAVSAEPQIESRS
jgi:hypothetical protein